MSNGRKRHTRKVRHQAKQALRFGPKAKPTHRLKSGRTGHVHTKKLRSREI